MATRRVVIRGERLVLFPATLRVLSDAPPSLSRFELLHVLPFDRATKVYVSQVGYVKVAAGAGASLEAWKPGYGVWWRNSSVPSRGYLRSTNSIATPP